MFICPACLAKHYTNDPSPMLSRGTCEKCEKHSNDCSDIPSDELVAKPRTKRPGAGFAALDREKLREIGRLGGKAVHVKGTAHEWTPEEARIAGRKGAQASAAAARARKAALSSSDGSDAVAALLAGSNTPKLLDASVPPPPKSGVLPSEGAT